MPRSRNVFEPLRSVRPVRCSRTAGFQAEEMWRRELPDNSLTVVDRNSLVAGWLTQLVAVMELVEIDR
jgi:hypothetical protein